LKIRDAEAAAEDEAVDINQVWAWGWQVRPWWLNGRIALNGGHHQGRSGPLAQRAANNNLAEVPLEDLESAIQEAAELKRSALADRRRRLESSIMPYQVDAQRRFFHAAEARGDISKKTVKNGTSASKGKSSRSIRRKDSGRPRPR